jgi:hypothetical protein
MLPTKSFYIAIVLFLTCSCGPGRDPVPEQLLGTWHTSMATHAGSTMEISKHVLIFTSDRGVDARSRIVGCKTILEKGQTVYQVSYQDQYKNEYELSLLYDPADGGTVRLKNQPQLEWKRTGA